MRLNNQRQVTFGLSRKVKKNYTQTSLGEINAVKGEETLTYSIRRSMKILLSNPYTNGVG